MRLRSLLHTTIRLAAAAAMLAAAVPAQAIDLSYGDFSGKLDTTLSLGAQWRVQGRSSDLIGRVNGGNRYSSNGDEGDLNFNKAITSSLGKVTHDLEARYGMFTGFARATYWYDSAYQRGTRAFRQLSQPALNLVGKDFEVLDAWLGVNLEPVEGHPIELRGGRQVVSWGESSFIPSGINVLNPIDVNRIRVPGAELREALTPIEQLWTSVGLTENLSFEGVYQFAWNSIETDPPGSFFSTNDFAGDGGQYVMTGFGTVDQTSCPGNANCVPRKANRNPKDSGQYGAALRYYLPFLDTELSAYYINYHSRLPIISANAVTTILAGPTPIPSSAKYFLEYPQDIKVFGGAFNSEIGSTGIAIQGEYSLTKDAPLQIDDIELLLSGLCSSASQLGACPNPITGVSSPTLGLEIPGYRRFNVSEAQATVTKLFGPTGKASQIVLVANAGLVKVHDMPSKSTLRFEGPGTDLPGNALAAAGSGVPQQKAGFADDFSWGYRLVSRVDFSNVWGTPLNMSPRLSFQHDVTGTSPGPGGPFIESRKAVSMGLEATYLGRWAFDLSYTNFFGAGAFNLVSDRDFVAAVVKYAI